MLNETFSAIFKHRVKRRICFLAKNTNLVMSLLVCKDVCLVPLSGWKRKKSKNDNFMNKRVFCAKLCQKWLWKRGYMCFRAFSMENDRGFRCHRWCYRVIIINLQHTQNLLLKSSVSCHVSWCMSVTLQYDLNKDFHRADENGGQSLDLLYATCQYFTVNLMGEIFDALFNFLRDLSKQKRHAHFKTNSQIVHY